MTVADIIQMATFGSQPWARSPDADVLSADGRLHAVVLKRGDIEHNTNVFSLLVFRTDALFTQPMQDTVMALSSSSNRPAISHVTWLGDNHTLAFLGEGPRELAQVYTVDIRTRHVTQLTRHATEITTYDISPSGGVIVYYARQAADTSGYPIMRERGFALRPTQLVSEVIQGVWSNSARSGGRANQLFVWRAGASAPFVASEPGRTYQSCDADVLSVAPRGKVALLKCTRPRLPASWRGYTERELAQWIGAGHVPAEFALLDLERGAVDPLVDAPAAWPTWRWAPTGEAIVLANTFLPLDVEDPAERRLRGTHRGIIEVDVRTQRLTVIAHSDSLAVVAWEPSSNTVAFVPVTPEPGAVEETRPVLRYRKTTHGWVKIRGGHTPSSPVLFVEQGMNLPPRLVAVDRGTSRRAVLLDPNRNVGTLRVSREEIVRWRTKDGQAWAGGLYLPPDFVAGRRYPLVIQTHGFDSTAFHPDGSHATANAAQPMAAHGMLVLQLGILADGGQFSDLGTPREAPSAMEAIEGAIDELDSLGLIDRSRVGLIGFSRTCFHVLYTLTHSSYPFAAAAITDGVDMSYLQYMLFQHANAGADEASLINGGPPFGKTLDLWRERAPGFTLDRVTAPLRLEAIGLPAVLEEWEPYAALLLQHKPVELFVIPEGAHLLAKPWERLASSQGNADWFRFWLKGEEDPDPAKADQYARWRELRKLQQQQAVADTSGVRQ